MKVGELRQRLALIGEATDLAMSRADTPHEKALLLKHLVFLATVNLNGGHFHESGIKNECRRVLEAAEQALEALTDFVRRGQ